MPAITVKVKRRRSDKAPIDFTYDFGENATESTARFNTHLHDVVHALFVASATQQLQDHIRRLLTRKKNPLTNEAVQAELANWKPVIKRRGKSALEKVEKELPSLTPAEVKELLRRLGGSDADIPSALDRRVPRE